MVINHSCPTRMLASGSNFSPVMAELRELKADIYELGRSLDSGTTARRSHNELSCTKVPLGLTGSSLRPSSSGAPGLAVVKRRSCRSKDNHGARPPSPPPRFSHPTKATHKEVMCLAYNGVSDVPRLVQRVEESARLVSSEKEDALQALRTEKDETVRLQEALWQAGGFERRWKELVEESRVLKRKLESTERIRLRQKELIAELQADEVGVDFPVAAEVALGTFTQSRGRAETRHTKSSSPMHRSGGQRSEKSKLKVNLPPGCQPDGTAKKRGVLGPQRRQRREVQRDGCFFVAKAGSRSLKVGESLRLRLSSAGRGSETKIETTASTRRHDKSSKGLVRFQASGIRRNTEVVAPRTADGISRKERLVARRQGGSGALDGRRVSGARRSRLSQGQEKMKPGIKKTSRLSRSLRGLEVHNKIRRSSQMSMNVTVPRRSSRRDSGFCAPTASSSGKARQWEDFA